MTILAGWKKTSRRQATSARHVAFLVGGLVLAAGPALAGPFPGNNYGDAGNNNAPPAGAILDLGGGETGTAAQTVNHGAPVAESVNFTAGVSDTDITFAFREDPAFISFGDVSLINDSTHSTNLLLNGNFAGGAYTSSGNTETPVDWNYANIYGSEAGGVLTSCSGFTSGNCWYDGSVQAYDALDQGVNTTVGDVYTLSFSYTDNSSLTTFSDLSTNGDTTDPGGNGIDILAYAQAGLPTACTTGTVCGGGTSVPEPGTLVVMATALLGLGMVLRRRNA